MSTATAVVEAAGITYRQLDYWSRRGYLGTAAQVSHGSGNSRDYTDEEKRLAVKIGQFTREGYTLAVAVRLANEPDKAEPPSPAQTLDDVVDRLRRAEASISEILESDPAQKLGETNYRDRLRGKREGLRLARSYVEELQR